MDWQQKARAIEALGDIKIGLTYGGKSWMCSTERCIEISDGHMLKGTCGYGGTPEAAVDDFWQMVTTLAPGEVLVSKAYTGERRHFLWNGFMWDEQPLPKHLQKAEAEAAP